jgi:hypothetical protein
MQKSELLNWLQGEYRQWEALLDQVGEARTSVKSGTKYVIRCTSAAQGYITMSSRRVVALLPALAPASHPQCMVSRSQDRVPHC